jgi:E3 ubiquitin-protein ligase HERC4
VELAKSCSEIHKNDTVDLELISTIEVIFKSLACLNASFLLAHDAHNCCTGKNNGVDMEAAMAAFDAVQKVENDSVKQIIWDSITADLLPSLSASPADVETLRVYLSLPLYHEFMNAKNYTKLQSPFGEKLLVLGKIPLKIITGWWTLQACDYFERLVDSFKGVVSFILHAQVSRVVTVAGDKQMARYDKHLVTCLNILLMLFRINHQERKQKVPYEAFNLPEVTELLDVRQDYIQWLFDTNPSNFHLCSYPFLFDAPAKMMILQTDQAVQMHNAMQAATAQSLMTMFTGVPGASQFIVLNVARENIVEDTIRELAQYRASDLKKPLKVEWIDFCFLRICFLKKLP